eukprot:TRINITY_DN8863_c0_g1_i1.p1 TRINITY_DN8863_c0_g1~~TRINITY_DN8863_c0_g1_i1.p1  ORF type:complete len:699 (-),score=153.32 TRINITY_DN8863_c0_g1_i1:51-2147(-)
MSEKGKDRANTYSPSTTSPPTSPSRSRFTSLLSPGKRKSSAQLVPAGGPLTKDCSITVKVFEARNIPPTHARKAEAAKNDNALERARKFVAEITNPNLMSLTDTTDPYCQISVDQQTMCTRTLVSKLNPFWCEEFSFSLREPAVNMTKVVLTVFDEKKFSAEDDVLGKLVIPLVALRDQREREMWLPIQTAESTQRVPQIHLLLDYRAPQPGVPGSFSFQPVGGRNIGLSQSSTKAQPLYMEWNVKHKNIRQPTPTEVALWDDVFAIPITRECTEPVEHLNITLYRDAAPADPSSPSSSMPSSPQPLLKSSTDTNGGRHVFGNVIVSMSDVGSTFPCEQWFCLYQREQKLGELRVKVKYTEDVVLPFSSYTDLLEILVEPDLLVVKTLGAVTKQREAVAFTLVRLFEHQNRGLQLLEALTSDEIDSTSSADIIFRGNTIATKTLDQYMKLMGMPYLHHVLGDPIKRLYYSQKSCEVDPGKLTKGEDLKRNWRTLFGWVEEISQRIFNSVEQCPPALREVFHSMQQKVLQRYPDDHVTRYTVISGFIFLRFFCPAILAPKLFELMPDHPEVIKSRYLILIAKALQNLSNLVEFGDHKEAYMKDMNKFVVGSMDTMKKFIDDLCVVPEVVERGPIPPIIIEKKLAGMYRHIMRAREDMVEHIKTKGNPAEIATMERLQAVLERVEKEVHAVEQESLLAAV